jgi:hypothetical protein
MWNWLTGSLFGSGSSQAGEIHNEHEQHVEDEDQDQMNHSANPVSVANDFTPVCEAAQGSLNLYQIEEDMFIPVVKLGYISLLEPRDVDSFNSKSLRIVFFSRVLGVFQVSSQEGNVMARMEIKSDSQIKFDKTRHSIVWAVVSNDGSFHSLEFVFENADAEIEFKKLLAIKIFEASRQESFKNAVENVRSGPFALYADLRFIRRPIKIGSLMHMKLILKEILPKMVFWFLFKSGF